MQPNYCPFCGSKLVENAKFCSQCGKPVQSASEKDDTNLPRQGSGIEEASSTESNSQKVEPIHTIKIGKYDLHIAESIIAYNKLRSLFVDNAETCRHTFESFYNLSVTNFETLYDKALPKILELSATSVRFATSTLEKYGLHGITPEEFLQLARNDIHLEQDLQVYADIATDLVSFAEQLSGYRANNRSGGLQWQGGGFGLSGAIKGTLMAGALSLGTDAIRGIGHAIVNSADRARFKKLQIDLYNARDHKAFLGQKLFDFCLNLFDTTARLLEKKGLIVHPPLDTASAIGPILDAFNLLEQRKPSMEDYKRAVDLTLTGMTYDPYLLNSYLTLYRVPFIDNTDLLKLVRFFGVETEFSAKITEYEKEEWDAFTGMGETTVQSIDRKIARAKELSNQFCYIHVPRNAVDELEKKKNELIKKEAEDGFPSPDYSELLDYNNGNF